MLKNYIANNILFLYRKEKNLTQDEFGSNFELNRGAITNYVNNKALPKIETIQRICLHYNISIDDFINNDLSKIEIQRKQGFVNEPPEGYGIIDLKYVELLENTVKDKDKIIKALEEKILQH